MENTVDTSDKVYAFIIGQYCVFTKNSELLPLRLELYLQMEKGNKELNYLMSKVIGYIDSFPFSVARIDTSMYGLQVDMLVYQLLHSYTTIPLPDMHASKVGDILEAMLTSYQ